MFRGACVAALAAVLVACGPSGTLTGKITVTGGDSDRATVTLTGEVTRAAAVGADGTYAFEGLPDGVYLVEASVPSTLETQLAARGQVSDGAGTVEELVFVGTGTVKGRVLAPGGSQGAEVLVAGLPIRQNVSEDGTFEVKRIPAGAQTLIAVREGFEPTYLQVTVGYAQTLENQTLSLSEAARGPGKISGRAYFFDRDSHAGIRVKVEGTQITAQTNAEGRYTLLGVPLGYVTLVAEAQGYASTRQINVLSTTGGELHAPDLRLNHQVPRFTGTVHSIQTNVEGTKALFVGTSDFDTAPALWFVDFASDAPAKIVGRHGAISTSLTVWWNEGDSTAAVRFGSGPTLFVANLETGGLVEATGRLYDGEVRFAGNRLFFLESGEAKPVLAVHDLAKGTTTRLEQVDSPGYCGTGWGGGRYQVSAQGHAAWLQAEGGNVMIARVWNGTMISTASFGQPLSCLTYAGDGNQLLAMKLFAPNTLWNLTSGSPVKLYEMPEGWYLSWDAFPLTGDRRSVLVIEESPTSPYPSRVLAIAAAGGTPTVLASTDSYLLTFQLQEGGSLVAFGWSNRVEVRSADGTVQKTWTNPDGSTYGSLRFSPDGKYFLWQFAVPNPLNFADTRTWVEKTLPSPTSINSILSNLSFSPQDKVLWYGMNAGAGTRMHFVRTADGSALDLPFVDASAPSMVWSSSDRHVLMRYTGNDRLVDTTTGAVQSLSRTAYGFSTGAGPFFSGSEAHLLFTDTGSSYGRVLRATTTSGEVRHVADNESSLSVRSVGNTGRVWIHDVSSAGEPRGLYTLDVP